MIFAFFLECMEKNETRSLLKNIARNRDQRQNCDPDKCRIRNELAGETRQIQNMGLVVHESLRCVTQQTKA